jgi:hypothetical protein
MGQMSRKMVTVEYLITWGVSCIFKPLTCPMKG